MLSLFKNMIKKTLLLLFTVLSSNMFIIGQTQPLAWYDGPIIDMHVHARHGDKNGPSGLCYPVSNIVPHFDPQENWGTTFQEAFKNPNCSNPIWSATTDETMREETLAAMKKNRVIGVVDGEPELVLKWQKEAPDHVIPSMELEFLDRVSADSIRSLITNQGFRVLGEIAIQYQGIAPNDPQLDPYWKVCQEQDIPIAIHLGCGPPGVVQLGSPNYNAAFSSPYLLEDVLKKFPKLRVSVMHFGEPLVDEMIAMMYLYPRLYVDIGGIQWAYPTEYFYEYQLKKMVAAGFSKRIMHGSDNMIWPGMIYESIKIIQEAPFLTAEQKADILYNNAARFLRLSKEEIAKHHN